MKYTNSKMLVEHTDKPNNFHFHIVHFGEGVDTVENLTLEEVMQKAVKAHKDIRPAGGVEFWQGLDDMNGKLSPEFLDELIETLGGGNE